MKLNRTFIIQHKETKVQWKTSKGKSAWRGEGYAKSSWYSSCGGGQRGYFDEQDEYEIVELRHESEDKLQEAVQLLQEVLDGIIGQPIDYDLCEKALNFIKENR